MPKHIALSLDPAGNLNDPGTTRRGNIVGRTVIWEIKEGENIESFRIEGKGTSNYFPFTGYPNPEHGIEVELTVRRGAPRGEWEYKIHWKKKGSEQEYTLDPKIAVNPIAPLTELILTVITLGLSSVLIYRVMKKKNHHNR